MHVGRCSGWLLGMVLLLLPVSTPEAVQQDLPGKDWPLVGGDWTSARYSTLEQINTANVKTLAGAWNKRLGGGSTRATPVVKNGVLILPAGESVLALNAKTGETIWTWQYAKPGASAEGGAPRSPMESIAGEPLPNIAGAALGEG